MASNQQTTSSSFGAEGLEQSSPAIISTSIPQISSRIVNPWVNATYSYCTTTTSQISLNCTLTKLLKEKHWDRCLNFDMYCNKNLWVLIITASRRELVLIPFQPRVTWPTGSYSYSLNLTEGTSVKQIKWSTTVWMDESSYWPLANLMLLISHSIVHLFAVWFWNRQKPYSAYWLEL